jgi:hypothetical protein
MAKALAYRPLTTFLWDITYLCWNLTIAGSIVFLRFRSDAAMSESRQTVRDFQPRQLFTSMRVELWREFLRSVERSDGNVNFVRPEGRFV